MKLSILIISRMADGQKYQFYIHAGFMLDWTSKEVQAQINEILIPHLKWVDRKGKTRYVKLKKNPYVAMSFYRDSSPKFWYEMNEKKEYIGSFQVLHFRRDYEDDAILEGSIAGKKIYVVISCYNRDPMNTKRFVNRGYYDSVDIDMKFPVRPYAFVEDRLRKQEESFPRIMGSRFIIAPNPSSEKYVPCMLNVDLERHFDNHLPVDYGDVTFGEPEEI